MMTLEYTVSIPAEELRAQVQEFKKNDFRLVGITALDFGQELELIYLFDRELELRGLRIRGPREEKFKSITDIFLAAFLAENEIQDFYNIAFDDLAVNYQGHMFLEEETRNLPYGKITVKDKTALPEEE
ncbi:NADH-quinone oxidoreductase subunit C [Desulfonatronovibrio hydrogenovorans]|uniref:NADH-quinone oxidoreductase subunit C n=1 Tax=Desulfonatronovibrio hydrogenovorans TaxID=53245 RepID=UPI00048C5E7D|nr:NADH-quinone oxidoreductase subunit C [Desulfonatronovibrio hydrogenovorans]